MSLLKMRRRRAANKGFNLIEAAIVLGIVGLVVGGIWVAATSVYANLRAKKATDELLSIVQSVRALYSTSTSTNLGAAVDMTQQVGQANALPGDVLTTAPNAVAAGGANVTNPWGGGLAVTNFNAAGTIFQVTYSNVPSAACLDFVMRNAGASHDVGMSGISGAVATAFGAAVGVPAAIAQALTPGVGITLANAQTECASAAAANRNISFFFALRG